MSMHKNNKAFCAALLQRKYKTSRRVANASIQGNKRPAWKQVNRCKHASLNAKACHAK